MRPGSALIAKLEAIHPRLVIFTFKKAATKLFGSISGNGLIPGIELAGARIFVMPGPYEASSTVAVRLRELHELAAEV